MLTRIGLFTAAVVCTLFVSACGSSNSSSGPTDTTPPTATVTPGSGLLSIDDVIVIHFDERMDDSAGNFTISGTLAAESDGGTWSTGTNPNDTLTIAPAGGTWSADTGRTLIVNARDRAGNAAATVSETYDLFSGTLYYVSSSAPDDTGDGLTTSTAKQTIMGAINAASNPATVLVEEGVYSVMIGGTPRVTLKEGVSLYGGYSLGFGFRDPKQYVTSIVDLSNYVSGVSTSPNFAVIAGTGVTGATIFDGFTILGSTQADSNLTSAVRVYNGGAPVIQNNILYGGAGTQMSYGMFIVGSTPLVRRNSIHGGSGGTNSVGVSDQSGADTIFQNNLIFGGSGGTAIGMYIFSSSPEIRNNTIHGGSGTNGYVVGIFGNSPPASPVIENNNILTSAQAYCIYEAGNLLEPVPSPGALNNNNLFGCDTLYRDVGLNCPSPPSLDRCDITEVNALTDIAGGSSNNVSIDPKLADIDGADNDISTLEDNNWRLTDLLSAEDVKTGGLNGYDQVPAWSFITDRDTLTRPSSGQSWSIGAYEPVAFATMPIPSFDHSMAADPGCTSSGCHDGASVRTIKSPSHPLTSNTCELCHSSNMWWPSSLPLPFAHDQTTDTCFRCHDNAVASGKNAMHVPSSDQCEDCHVSSSWLD